MAENIMTYAVKEIFLSLQGEGAQSGRPAIFCRFAGCNLWSGLEKDRAKAQCSFCDTDFVGTDGQNGGKFATADALGEAIAALWGNTNNERAYVIFTGGEPCLQLDKDLLEAVAARGFEIAIETNGTLPVPEGVDWICVSPKPNSRLVQTYGQELKFIYPQTDFAPHQFENLDFTHFFLQPLDAGCAKQTQANIKATVDYCLAHPQWRVSLQTHKILDID